MNMQELRDRVTAELEQRNLTQSEASRGAGVYTAAVNKLLCDKRYRPSRDVARRLALYFGLDVNGVYEAVGYEPDALDQPTASVEAELDRVLARLGYNARARAALSYLLVNRLIGTTLPVAASQ